MRLLRDISHNSKRTRSRTHGHKSQLFAVKPWRVCTYVYTAGHNCQYLTLSGDEAVDPSAC